MKTMSRVLGVLHARCLLFIVFIGICDHGRAQSWIKTSAPDTNWTGVASSADGTTLIAAHSDYIYGSGNRGYIYVSINSGSTWTRANIPSNYWNSVAVSANGSNLMAAASSPWNLSPLPSIYISTNSGGSWTEANIPTNAWRSVACSANGQRMVAVSQNSWIYYSSDAGQNWTSNNVPSSWTGVACSADGTRIAAVSSEVQSGANGSGTIYTSQDGGATWIQRYPGTTWPIWLTVASSADGKKLVAGGQVAFTGHCCPCANICTSTNIGMDWSITSACIWYWASVASSANGARLAAGQAYPGPIYLSSDSGVSWTNSGSFPGECFVSSTADGTRLVVAANGGGIYTSQSTGQPVLAIRRDGTSGEPMLSWPISSSRFVLQEKPDLSASGWTDVATAPVLNWDSLEYQVAIPSSSDLRFYRLRSAP